MTQGKADFKNLFTVDSHNLEIMDKYIFVCGFNTSIANIIKP